MAALVASLLAVVGAPSPVGAAVPGNGSVFDCFGNTIYTVHAVTTLPSTANQNALAIAKGGAKAAVVAQTGNNGSVPLYVYDAELATWRTAHTGFAGNAQNFPEAVTSRRRDVASIGLDEAAEVGPRVERPGATAITGFDSGTVPPTRRADVTRAAGPVSR